MQIHDKKRRASFPPSFLSLRLAVEMSDINVDDFVSMDESDASEVRAMLSTCLSTAHDQKIILFEG